MNNFKVGDKVICVENLGEYIKKGDTAILKEWNYEIIFPLNVKVGNHILIGHDCNYYSKYFKLLDCKEKEENMCSGITKEELTFPEKPDWYKQSAKKEEDIEFKIDKLGWYGDNRCEKYKIVSIGSTSNLATAIDEDGDFYGEFTRKGYKLDNDYIILIKYLGPELPKEPRKFEFEGYLGESPMTTIEDMELGNILYETNLIRDKFDYKVSKEFVRAKIIPGYEKTIKWHVTMKEIFE